jgi:hypothetical protein
VSGVTGGAVGLIGVTGAAVTVKVLVAVAVAEPLHEAVWPVKTNLVEHPSLSVTVSVAVNVPAEA